MGLFRWLADIFEGPFRVPIPGETFRLFDTGQEVVIVHVQPKDQLIGEMNRMMQQPYRPAHVRYKTKSGKRFEAPYRDFVRSGRAVPSYDPVP